MPNKTILPPEFASAIGAENKEFAVKAEREKPIQKSIAMILFGSVWTAISGIAMFTGINQILKGEEISFKLNGSPAVASLDNLSALLMPGIMIGIFVLIGLGMLCFGIYSIFKKGGYFVGTKNRLVYYKNGNIKSMDWEQFNGNIEVRGNDQKGTIILQMRTGKIVHKKHGGERFVPDIVYITGIPNALTIEQICRKRIKENDPTPTQWKTI
ncbi:MAG: hypothetical protein WC897_03615 [Candidatus Gracilibacteria bacterium]